MEWQNAYLEPVMTIISTVFGTILAHQTAALAERADAMQIALITIAALAAANLLLIILMVVSRKKKSE